VNKIPEKIKVELEKWEKAANNVVKKAKQVPGKVSAEVKEEAIEIAQGGKRLLMNIDKRMDEVEEKSKKTLRDLRERLKKAYKSMGDQLAEIDTDLIEPIEYR
jgi:hypothetical protein